MQEHFAVQLDILCWLKRPAKDFKDLFHSVVKALKCSLITVVTQGSDFDIIRGLLKTEIAFILRSILYQPLNITTLMVGILHNNMLGLKDGVDL